MEGPPAGERSRPAWRGVSAPQAGASGVRPVSHRRSRADEPGPCPHGPCPQLCTWLTRHHRKYIFLLLAACGNLTPAQRGGRWRGTGGLSAVSGTARAVPCLAPGPLRSRPLGSTTRPGVVVHLVVLLPASAPAPPIREPFRPPASELHPRHFTPALRACPPVIGPRACRCVCNSEGHPWSRADGCLGPAKCHLWVPEPTSLGLGCPVCEEEMPICEVAGTDWDCAPGMQQVLTGHW